MNFKITGNNLRRDHDAPSGRPPRPLSVSLPNFKQLRPGQASLAISSQENAALLIDKHQETISHLREKLGFKHDKTVIAWLLEQIEQSEDMGKTIFHMLNT
jgi:hypothetical protein